MGYQIVVFKEYISNYDAEVHAVHWNHKKKTSYKPPEIDGLKYYNKSNFDLEELKNMAFILNPDIVFICGWMDKDYLRVSRLLKKKGIPVVAGCDTQWKGSLKQWLNIILFPFTLKKCFSHIWVAGPYQYEYVRKLGFAKSEIIFNCYSADIELFNKAYENSVELKTQKYPHRFLFVGRFEKVKGIDLLIDAWEGLGSSRRDWELCFIGNGSLYPLLSKIENIKVVKFLQPEELIKNVQNAGCFILPSRAEPWAVVLHEFSAAGLPIICSDVCGAAPVFTISNYNGYTFKSEDVTELMDRMKKIIEKKDSELLKMSRNSNYIGQKITPEIAASSFLSVL